MLCFIEIKLLLRRSPTIIYGSYFLNFLWNKLIFCILNISPKCLVSSTQRCGEIFTQEGKIFLFLFLHPYLFLWLIKNLHISQKESGLKTKSIRNGFLARKVLYASQESFWPQLKQMKPWPARKGSSQNPDNAFCFFSKSLEVESRFICWIHALCFL